MIDSAVTDLPQPDSPTIPSVWPGSIENEIPSTARTTPSRVKKCVFRSLTSSTGSPAAMAYVSLVRGSKASRSPSAMKFAQSTSVAIAIDGIAIWIG